MKVVGIIFAVLAGTLAVYFWLNGEPPIRYRLTATVESGGKVYTNSGVIQIDMNFQEYWSPPAIPHVTADALIVEVPGNAPIFLLLTSDWSVDWDSAIVFDTFKDQLPTPRTVRGDTRFLVGSTASATVPPDRYPLIAAFGDLTKPDSVYEVFADDLSPPLEPGARVISLTIEMTRDPPTTGGVATILPWSGSLSNRLDGNKYHTPGGSFANSLTRLDFSKRGQ